MRWVLDSEPTFESYFGCHKVDCSGPMQWGGGNKNLKKFMDSARHGIPTRKQSSDGSVGSTTQGPGRSSSGMHMPVHSLEVLTDFRLNHLKDRNSHSVYAACRWDRASSSDKTGLHTSQLEPPAGGECDSQGGNATPHAAAGARLRRAIGSACHSAGAIIVLG